MWTDTMKEVYEEGTEAGDLVTVVTNFDSVSNGFHVPAYVIEGDPERGIEPLAPDLKRVEDLKDYPELFPDPEDPNKGIFRSEERRVGKEGRSRGWTCPERKGERRRSTSG